MPAGQVAGEGADLDAIVEGVTNSVMQDIAKSLVRKGCEGGLGDSRKLRAALREVVARNVHKMADAQKSQKGAR